MSVDGLVVTRQGVFRIIMLVLYCLDGVTAVRQGARVPSTNIYLWVRDAITSTATVVVVVPLLG